MNLARYYYWKYLNRKYSKYTDEQFEKLIIQEFEKRLGRLPDITNPQSFNEKIQWLKLHYYSKKEGILADKYMNREYVSEVIGAEHLVPLLFAYDDPREILWEEIPDNVVIKATHGSGMNRLIFSKKEINRFRVVQEMRRWLNIDYGLLNGLELHYRYCTPRIIIEKMLKSTSGEIPNDYKVFTFNNGSPVILVCSDRFTDGGMQEIWFDSNWKKIDVQEGGMPNDAQIARPSCLSRMLELSERLRGEYPFVRVDWYEIDGNLYFGELTFTPKAGFEDFSPSSFDYELGARINLKLFDHGN